MEQTKFIDPETDFSPEKEDNFEQIVIAQMRKCADLLSKDVFGIIQQKDIKGKIISVSTRDLRDEVNNSINTFQALLDDFIKEDHRKKIKEIEKNMNDKIKELQEKFVVIPGVGYKKVKDAQLFREDPIMAERLNLVLEGNRQLFGILIKVYNKSKKDIAKFTTQ